MPTRNGIAPNGAIWLSRKSCHSIAWYWSIVRRRGEVLRLVQDVFVRAGGPAQIAEVPVEGRVDFFARGLRDGRHHDVAAIARVPRREERPRLAGRRILLRLGPASRKKSAPPARPGTVTRASWAIFYSARPYARSTLWRQRGEFHADDPHLKRVRRDERRTRRGRDRARPAGAGRHARCGSASRTAARMPRPFPSSYRANAASSSFHVAGSRGGGRVMAPLGHERQDRGGQLGHAPASPGVLRGDDVVELPFVHPLVGGVPAAGDRHEHHEGGQPTAGARRRHATRRSRQAA